MPWLRRSKWKIGLISIVVLIGILLATGVRIHFGYFADDKAAANAAENAMIRQYNSRNFDAIYNDSADVLKSGISRIEVVNAMQLTFDKFGAIADDKEAATTCFPNQVRMVRWMKSSRGDDLTALMIWFVPDGKTAQLLSAQVNAGHSSFDPAIVRAHSCESR